MKRGGALPRRTPLRTRKAMRRTSGQKARTVKLSARPKPAVPPAVRAAVRLRAGDSCERCGSQGTDAHHRVLRARGGSDDLSNLAWLCRADHRWAHDNPAEATEGGWMVASWEDPESVPARLYDGRLVCLSEAGGYVVLSDHQEER